MSKLSVIACGGALLAAIVLLLPWTLAGSGIPAADRADAADEAAAGSQSAVSISGIAGADSAFGLELLKGLQASAGENVFISPASIAIALQMTCSGAEGRTRQEMTTTLGLKNWPTERVNNANRQLAGQLKSLNPDIVLKIANSLWMKGDTNKGYVETLQTFYESEVFPLQSDAAARVNDWVSDRTEGKIKNILQSLPPASEMILVNAIYFKGLWQEKFDEAQTVEADFTNISGALRKVRMMQRGGSFRYLRGKNFQAAALPYKGGKSAMYIFMPDEGIRVGNWLQEVNAARLKAWIAAFRSREGNLSMPRFKLEYSRELKEPLRAMGMPTPFTSEADFSGMAPRGLFIDQVKHKTFVEVGEAGTEAAGATAVVMVRSAMMPAFSLVINRPFFCIIRDERSGLLLFAGVIGDPS